MIFTHLAVVAWLPLIPATPGSTVTRERRRSTEQDVKDNAETPQITAFIINTDLLIKCLHHLGGHVLCRATLKHNVPEHIYTIYAVVNRVLAKQQFYI